MARKCSNPDCGERIQLDEDDPMLERTDYCGAECAEAMAEKHL